MPQRTLITCALPYANGSIHLGHMVEHIQTDIYVRFLRSCGEDIVFLCADDTHGTPIELNAAKAGIPPEQFIARFHSEHQRDFADFGVEYDTYHSTHSPENRHYSEYIYSRLKDAGLIVEREIEQAYDAKEGRFLADRFIRGTCPNCRTPDQYGDACEHCGATYNPRELLDAKSAISGEPLEWKKSMHLFFQLSRMEPFLREQLARPGFLDPGQAAQLRSFFEKGLADWDISRDGPYFGFSIPCEVNKFFYVWLDAPIGYIAATEKWAKDSGRVASALAYWAADSDARILHFIGKDILYFHGLFWPAVLKVAGLKIPSEVHVHGHLTVEGEKMSKTRGTFINARTYLDALDPAYLRFFYASVLGPGADDLDFSLKEFRERVNAELVNNLANLANRTLTQLVGEPLPPPSEGEGRTLVESALERAKKVRTAFEAFDYRAAMKVILEIGQSANQFLTTQEPWKKKNTDPGGARAVLIDVAEVVYIVAGLLEPVVPKLSAALFTQLDAPRLTYRELRSAAYPLLQRGKGIGTPAPLIGRMEPEQVQQLIMKMPEPASPAAAAAPVTPPTPTIDYADFARVELKTGRILSAQPVPKADRLLHLTVDVGESQPRTIVSGIAEAYEPETIVGKNVVVVMNLAPRSLKGIESRGMLLTSGAG